jgi:DNA invertase Pin-like site-specific DNA recombinase
VSRSVRDFTDLVDHAQAGKWNLVVLDLGLDLSTPMGEFAAHILCAAAQLERRMIGQRTKDGLAAAKANGVHVGRPPGVSDALCERIVEMRGDGMTLVAIAERLTAEKALTARGGTRWWPSTVNSMLSRSEVARR